jgi:hypothetical protein
VWNATREEEGEKQRDSTGEVRHNVEGAMTRCAGEMKEE